MTWIILGDSWSSTTLNTLESREFYPFDHSLFQHMRSRYGRDVECWATPGHSDLAQLQRLRWGVRHRPSQDLRVLWGWTDWSRCVGYDVRSRRFQSSPHYHTDYHTNRRIIQQLIQDSLLDPVLEGIKFYHWGGQSPVWLNTNSAPGDHTIISRDFAHEYMAAPHNSEVSTYVDASHNKPSPSVQDLWPTTPKDVAQRLERCNRKHYTWRRRNPRLYPDGGHLAWRHYTKLAQLLPAEAPL